MTADTASVPVAPEYYDEPLAAALVFRDLNTPNAISDLLHALTHLDALVNTVFSNVRKIVFKTCLSGLRGALSPVRHTLQLNKQSLPDSEFVD